jgi:uncharacterized Zn finger protein
MLTTLITPQALYELAGPAAFQRGEAYYSEGAVGRLTSDADSVTAKVKGTKTYQVELFDDDGELGYDCDCPRAADGYFCKHSVALGLAWLTEGARTADGDQDADTLIRDFLATQPVETLVLLLLNAARRDEDLYQSLLFKARSGGKDVAAELREAIDQATTLRGGRDWYEVGIYMNRIETVVEALADLLTPASAAALVELTEYAIERVEALLIQVDEEGEFSGFLETLCRLHLDACDMAAPDPSELAWRLFNREMTLPNQVCLMDVVTYQAVLGEAGLRAYRELAEAAWAKARPGDYRITMIMERLARLSGDVDELLAVKVRDLSSAWRYLQMAEILAEAQRDDAALEWAERGMKAFPNAPDNRLRDFLVGAYQRRQRHDEAVALTWIQFAERPDLERYKKLQSVADQAGIWPAQRARALELIEQTIRREAETTNHWKPKPSRPDFTRRVEFALWDADLESAWQFANQGICERNLLIDLAYKLEANRADDAITLYRRVIPPIIDQTGNHAYAEAVALVKRLGALWKAQQKAPEFVDYLISLRTAYKAKRNFMKLLDSAV